MLVTDGGQLIRCPVDGIGKEGRSTQGVIVFDVADDEHVVSVEHITDVDERRGVRLRLKLAPRVPSSRRTPGSAGPSWVDLASTAPDVAR